MKIIFFAHPLFLTSQSMPRFVHMLAKGMEERGHEVEIWRPKALFSQLKISKLKKWLGYIDQYLIFPWQVKRQLSSNDKKVLYVVTDHALGPYVPLIAAKPHVIHCHDFLAQGAAFGKIDAPITSFSGRKYQKFIQNGYSKGSHFISVSKKTKADLEKFLPSSPLFSKVVYNGLSDGFKPGSIADARLSLTDQFKIDLNPGYLLHVGGNQWYKNRTGVILLYSQWREHYGMKLPLILIGHPPSDQLLESYHQSPFNADIHFISNVDDDTVKLAYCGASVFLFPSLAEGFGWPIAEAMASGTIVITTNEAPMTEVAGEAGFLIERMPKIGPERENWLIKSTAVLQEAITLTEQERAGWVLRGVNNTRRFRMDETLDQLEIYYKDIMSDYDLKN